MENWKTLILVLTLVALHSFRAYSDENWVSIDCGATTSSVDDITGHTWETDDKYISSGENQLLIFPITDFPPMTTLRSFPTGSTNCYNLPLKAQSKYLVRAGFYYGNYDSLLDPPTFGLRVLNGKLKVNVTTSLDSDPIYHEFILTTRKNDVVDVCLIRTQEDQVPFISTLEATFIGQKAYRLMTNDMSLYLESRLNYGADQSVPERFPANAEIYNRIWKPQQVIGYDAVSTSITGPLTKSAEENSPPNVVLDSAIEATFASESIVLAVDFSQNSRQVSAYLVLYFDITPVSDQTKEENSNFAIIIDGQLMNVTGPIGTGQSRVVSVYPVMVSGGTANLTISPPMGASSSAFINAMEVFSVIDTSKAAASLSGSVFVTFFGLLIWFSYYCVVRGYN